MRYHRLVQPLFIWKNLGLPINVSLKTVEAVQAYDVIYNLLFFPKDMVTEDIENNAKLVLEMLGAQIERQISPNVFSREPKDDAQLEFDLERATNG